MGAWSALVRRSWPPRWVRNVFVSLRALDAKLDQVLEKLDTITQQQEKTMAQIDDVAAANAEKVNALEAKVNETITTLKELKDLVGSGTADNAAAVLAETNGKLDTLLASLGAAEADADPTPDA